MSGSRGFLLDTSVVLLASRQGSPVAPAIDAQFSLSASRFRPAICEVSVGELFAFSKGWGEKRRALLKTQLDRTLIIPIAHPGIYDRWAGMSSALRTAGLTIGQNDVWIAATTSVSGMTLLTTDKDFVHLRRIAALDVHLLDGRTGLVLS
jgi:tRNA(fMet)-specific endonuclease VapC